MRDNDMTALECVLAVAAILLLPVVLFLNRNGRWSRIKNAIEFKKEI